MVFKLHHGLVANNCTNTSPRQREMFCLFNSPTRYIGTVDSHSLPAKFCTDTVTFSAFYVCTTYFLQSWTQLAQCELPHPSENVPGPLICSFSICSLSTFSQTFLHLLHSINNQSCTTMVRCAQQPKSPTTLLWLRQPIATVLFHSLGSPKIVPFPLLMATWSCQPLFNTSCLAASLLTLPVFSDTIKPSNKECLSLSLL